MFQPLSILAALAFVLAGAGSPQGGAAEEEDAFVLNLIGMERAMPVPPGDAGHRIFVPLFGDCRIDLTEGEFEVKDGNCTDDETSEFQLPNPDPEDDGVSSYRVYVRALGTPGGNATLNTCVENEDGTWCSTETVFVARAAGESPSMDISRQALTVCYDADGDGTLEREQIFDDENADYFWQYSNNGLRLAQLKFVPELPTDISGPCVA